MRFFAAILILLTSCGGTDVVEVTIADKCLVFPGMMHSDRGCAYRWNKFPIGVRLNIANRDTRMAAVVALRSIMDKSSCEVFVYGDDINVEDREKGGGGCALNHSGEVISSAGISIGANMGYDQTVSVATHEFLHALSFGHSANPMDVMAPRVHPSSRISAEQADVVRGVYCGNFLFENLAE